MLMKDQSNIFATVPKLTERNFLKEDGYRILIITKHASKENNKLLWKFFFKKRGVEKCKNMRWH